MAKKSIYETSFAAGHTGGLYEADLQGVGDVWSDIESSRAMTSVKGQRRERTLDMILAATELTSQVAGGLQSRQEFKSSLKAVGADIDPSGKTSFEKVKVGGLKKLFQEPSYKIGDKVMSKADITTAGQMLQYGGSPKYDRFKFEPESMAEEVGGIGGFLKSGKEKLSSVLSPKAKTQQAAPKVETKTPEVKQEKADTPDWDAINKQQLADIESAKESYSKRKEQYDWLQKRGIIKENQQAQLKGLGSEAAGDIGVETDIPLIDNFGILGEHSSLIDLEEQERRRSSSVYGQPTRNIPRQ